MSVTWREGAELAPPRPDARGLARAAMRGVPLVALLGVGLALLLLLRLVERPLCHPRRPVTPWITVLACRGALRLLGIGTACHGVPLAGAGAVVVNHSSWLDILALNAARPVVFVSKTEVAGWAGIGWLARATGTLFVRREARGEAAIQARAVGDRVRGGETLVLFLEGTSSDGRRVLPFKPALLAGLLAPDLPAGTAVQPVTLSWEAPDGEDPRFYGWFGDAAFGPHALAVLASRRPGGVSIIYHAAIPVAGRNRKDLARHAEAAVRAALR